jgi:pimeloyl-ACP methyl ester carboxylesterase
MAVVELYSRDTGSGLPVVLLHAFPLSSAMWLAQREALGNGYRLLTPDQRGFGGSALGRDQPNLDLVADDVAALLDAKQIETAVIGGLSMGGYVAMALLRRHPHRIRGLILADTRSAADAEPARANRERIAAAVESTDSTVLVDDVLPTLVGPTTVSARPLILGRIRGMVQSAPPAAVAWAQRAMASRPDSAETLARVTVPTLVLVGEEDGLAPPAEAERMAGGIPGARLVRIPAVGHLSAVEAPEEFTAALSDFLRTSWPPAAEIDS